MSKREKLLEEDKSIHDVLVKVAQKSATASEEFKGMDVGQVLACRFTIMHIALAFSEELHDAVEDTMSEWAINEIAERLVQELINRESAN